VLLALATLLVLAGCATAPADGRRYLSTIPLHVYKTADDEKTESWVFSVLVHGAAEPSAARIELFSGGKLEASVQLAGDALAAVRSLSFKGAGFTAAAFADQDETYDLRHSFSEPIALKIDRISYHLRFSDGSMLRLEIPISTYVARTRLIFPIKGFFTVINGAVTDRGHSEWSQYFAYDITGLGPHLEVVRSNGETDDDYFGWGREVIAPAHGLVVYARNDVADNPKPGVVDHDALAVMTDPMWAAGGNCVVIDHGDGEFSFLAHMQRGSVRVKRGDMVVEGQPIGLVGNSGNAYAPHLHYHLMAGPLIFRSDPLPSRFENTDVPVPRRGQYVEAK
jgi:murein DD-endopeptidase MepM/ murein hydrolase activator NlpD